MRKYLLLLVVTMCIGLLSGCSNGESVAPVETNNYEEQQEMKDLAKETYELLNETAIEVDEVMIGVCKAWRFSIYEAEEYVFSYDSFGAKILAQEIGVSEADFKKGYEAYVDKKKGQLTGDYWYGTFLRDATCCVNGAVYAYYYNGKLTNIEDDLDTIQSNLQTLSNCGYEIAGLSTLRDYYSKVVSYKDFAISPTGNFAGLSSTVKSYQNELMEFKNNLSIDYN